MTRPEVILCVLLLLAALAVGLSFLGKWLLGPLFFYDLVRTARRNRHIPLRCLYATALLVVLFLVYCRWFPPRAGYLDQLFGQGTVAWLVLPRFAESFFCAFLMVQMAAVLLVTPAYTAGAIADEKERRTLDFLLATPLSDREIVLGTLASRLANLSLLLLAGLPVLSLVQFLGGLDPYLVLGAFAVTWMTMLSLGSLSLLISVFSRRTVTALSFAYGFAALYLVITWSIPGLNPLLATSAATNLATDVLPPGLLFGHAFFHGLFAVIFAGLADLNLRSAAQEESGPPALPGQASAPGAPAVAAEALPWPRPAVSDSPLFWKEMHVHNRLGPLPLINLLLWPAFFQLVLVGSAIAGGEMNDQVRGFGTAAACLMLLMVPLRSARSVSQERERRTLDLLLLTPVEPEEILHAKWRASLLVGWWGWLILGSGYILAAAVGGLHFLALPLLLAAWFVYAAFLSCLGLWFSTACATTLRATLLTVLVTLAAGVVTWSLSEGTASGLSRSPTTPDPWIDRFYAYGLAPPRALTTLAFGYRDIHDPIARRNILASLAGVVCYAAAAVALWKFTKMRFRKQTGRGPVQPARHPEEHEPPANREVPVEQAPDPDSGDRASRPPPGVNEGHGGGAHE